LRRVDIAKPQQIVQGKHQRRWRIEERGSDLRDLAKERRRVRPRIASEWIGQRRNDRPACLSDEARSLATRIRPAENDGERESPPAVGDRSSNHEVHGQTTRCRDSHGTEHVSALRILGTVDDGRDR
jgi:hypothetical protein